MDVLDRFSPATATWFRATFTGPTVAQRGAWEAVSSGEHTLVVAPTGSGKTLSAFLWAIDRLLCGQAEPGCRVLYVSPLKALAVDVERNLRSPLVGIGHTARRLGQEVAPVRVAVRSGDTPADERRRFRKDPAEILITTPESLFLLLTSSAREALAQVETVIVDEIHAVAGTKRGAHLAVSLERLDALLPRPAQRVGLSATVRPVPEVARFLAGSRPVTTVAAPSEKRWDLQVVVPVPDLADLAAAPAPGTSPRPGASVWPYVEQRIVDLVAQHRSTLVFANSRRLAERLTSRMNEIWAERTGGPADGSDPSEADPETHSPDPGTVTAVAPPVRTPAEVMGQAGSAAGAPPLLARAHHGSVSREQRAQTEDDLKAGRLPAVVATSSLELGIDMGAVDLVVQVEAPPSVASGLQRVGRAGHQVGAVSRGVLFPKFRGDLVSTAVVVERMRQGAIEQTTVPANPLDVLAQQVVAMCALDDWAVDDLHQLLLRTAPYAGLTRPVLEAVLDMLSGRYPSEDFAQLRPRLVWNRVTGTLSGRPGAQRLAVTSGGTIPDRGLFGVFLASGDGPGRRVGELDEEMVYESRVGDTFTLGTSTWQITEITHDRVLVTPAPGAPGRLPFWHGDAAGRPAELGQALGGFVRELGRLPAAQARDRVAAAGLDAWATDNLLGYLAEQRSATGHVPDDRTIVVERFRDELGDWRVVVHSPYGQPVHAPWALVVAGQLRQQYGIDVQAVPADDGIVLRLPETAELEAWGDQSGPGLDVAAVLEALLPDPDQVTRLVTEELGGSALFASRFRECAGRALLLPRRHPGRRQALWQQRQRASQLLSVASGYPSFPIVLETVRECLHDVFDVPALVGLLQRVRSHEVRVVEVETLAPSPFAASLLLGYVAQFLYEGDSPLAERRAAALTLDPALLAELLGTGDGLALADLLDPEALTRTEAELQQLLPQRQARDAEGLADLLRRLGPLSERELARRVPGPARDGRGDQGSRLAGESSGAARAGPSPPAEAGAGAAAGSDRLVGADLAAWLGRLESARRVIRVAVGGEQRWAAVEDAGRLRDALGTVLPAGLPDAFTAPVADPLGDLVLRFARTHVPFTAHELAAWLGVGVQVARDAARRLVGAGRLTEGDLRPDGWRSQAAQPPVDETDAPPQLCDPRVLSTVRRRSLAALRAEVEPVTMTDFARFLPAWQGVGEPSRGLDGVARAVDQLCGVALPASALETLVLPARVVDYRPGMLDELLGAGEVIWQGHGELARGDGWVSLYPADLAPLLLAPPREVSDELDQAVLDAMTGGGAYLLAPLAAAVGRAPAEVTAALWRLVWAGRVTAATLAPLRARMGTGSTTHTGRRPAARRSRYARTGARLSLGRPAAPTLPTGSGRWSLLPTLTGDPTTVGLARAEVLLDRYGVVTRGSVVAEAVDGGFAAVYRVLATAEEAGRVRRGYFVEGLGASQFGGTGAVDRLRASARPETGGPGSQDPAPALVLAACDPANPYGAALPWPEPTGSGRDRTGDDPRHRPARKAGAVVALVDGALVLYLERGGKTLLSFSDSPDALLSASQALAGACRRGSLGRLTVQKVDGQSVMTRPTPLTEALGEAGFQLTPRGLRLRA
ncbi:MAG: DEAD/DEAH box helicase [Actinomycetia bacterium]|nr:DEAD/DEAH box helicase [Actinomycetes bacterium]